jgi:hypothetical protein
MSAVSKCTYFSEHIRYIRQPIQLLSLHCHSTLVYNLQQMFPHNLLILNMEIHNFFAYISIFINSSLEMNFFMIIQRVP